MSQDDLTSSLQALLADHLVLVMKLHNYHWNVRGSHFRSVHELTEKYYDYFFKSYDAVAERILQIGGKPLVTVKSSLEVARVKEDAATSFTEEEVLRSALIDFNFLRTTALAAVSVADAADDALTEGLLLGFVEWLEKEIWMIGAILNINETPSEMAKAA